MNILLYLLQVTACTAVFYLFYFLLLSRLTFFTTNRWYLIVSLILSFAIPVLRITLSEQHPYVEAVQQIIYREPAVQSHVITPVIVQESIKPNLIEWDANLQAIYYVVAAALTIQLLATLLVFFKRIKGKRIISIGKVRVLSGQHKVVNGSFLNYIFLNDDELSAEEMQQIIAHELLHVKRCHSADRILVKLAQIALWFNPFIYLYARSVEQNHEFEVDREIARSTDKHNYANLLLHLSVAKQGMLYHSFSKVPLKKRISMLFTKPTNKMKRIIYVLIVPVVLISCLAFARLKKSHLSNNQIEKDSTIVYRQKIKQTPEQARLYKKQQEEFNKYQQTDDYKNKMALASGISGKAIAVTVKGTLPNKTHPGKQGVVLTTYNGNEYAIDSRYGQEKALVNMVKPGDLLTVKVFSWVVRQDYPVMITPAYVVKNKVKIFQLAEADKIPTAPFLYEANKVRFAEGQVSNIVKYSNGKWKSALFETVNGYKFNLTFKPSAPDLNSIEDGDHVRLRFVNEVKTGTKTFKINDWVSITTNVKDYGIKNPELFSRFYSVEKGHDIEKSNAISNTDTTKYSNIPGLNKLGKNPIVLINGKQYNPNILYKISRNSISAISVSFGDKAVNKYGTRAKDGYVIIKTRNGQIAYISSAEKENLSAESSVPKSQFYTRMTLKSESDEIDDKIIINTINGTTTATIPHKAKACFFINDKFYDENDVNKISPEIISSLATGGVEVRKNNPDPKLKGYTAVFSFKSKTSAKPLDIKTGSNIQDATKSNTITMSDEDSTVDDTKNRLHYLYGNAHVTYSDFELKADFVRLDEKNHLIFASGRIDPKTKKYIGRPVYKAGEGQPLTSDSLQISYDSGKSSVRALGENSKKDKAYDANKINNRLMLSGASGKEDAKHQFQYLYGHARVTCGDFELNADMVRFDKKNQLIFASGRTDSVTKKYIGRPTYKTGSDQPVTVDSLLLHYQIKDGLFIVSM